MVSSEESRMLHCPTCSIDIDRDVNAAQNILSARLRISPLGLSGEAVKENPTTMVSLESMTASQARDCLTNSNRRLDRTITGILRRW